MLAEQPEATYDDAIAVVVAAVAVEAAVFVIGGMWLSVSMSGLADDDVRLEDDEEADVGGRLDCSCC